MGVFFDPEHQGYFKKLIDASVFFCLLPADYELCSKSYQLCRNNCTNHLKVICTIM